MPDNLGIEGILFTLIAIPQAGTAPVQIRRGPTLSMRFLSEATLSPETSTP